MYSFLSWFSQILLLLLGFFLIIVVLLQRGRGGGLAGAFGGMGGQSAFGTKAGDVFTKITIVIAILWVVVSGASGFAMRAAANQKASQFPDAASTPDVEDPAIPTAPETTETPAGTSADEPAAGTATTPAGGEPEAAAPTGGTEPGATSSESTAAPEGSAPATSTPPASGTGDASNPN